MRVVVAAIFTLVILSPAGVVFAVVWTTPYLSSSAPPEAAAPTGPVRVLPAPDVQPGSLPASAVNVYANDLSGAQLLAAVVMSSLLGVTVFFVFGWLQNRIVGKWYDAAGGGGR